MWSDKMWFCTHFCFCFRELSQTCWRCLEYLNCGECRTTLEAKDVWKFRILTDFWVSCVKTAELVGLVCYWQQHAGVKTAVRFLQESNCRWRNDEARQLVRVSVLRSFSVSTLMVKWQEERPVCKSTFVRVEREDPRGKRVDPGLPGKMTTKFK